MSNKQWGHGFHQGTTKGFERGAEVGEVGGRLHVGEHAFHCVNAAIQALENPKDDIGQALGILRVLRAYLATETGRETVPQT